MTKVKEPIAFYENLCYTNIAFMDKIFRKEAKR